VLIWCELSASAPPALPLWQRLPSARNLADLNLDHIGRTIDAARAHGGEVLRVTLSAEHTSASVRGTGEVVERARHPDALALAEDAIRRVLVQDGDGDFGSNHHFVARVAHGMIIT
jgi:hypothetical protein